MEKHEQYDKQDFTLQGKNAIKKTKHEAPKQCKQSINIEPLWRR